MRVSHARNHEALLPAMSCWVQCIRLRLSMGFTKLCVHKTKANVISFHPANAWYEVPRYIQVLIVVSPRPPYPISFLCIDLSREMFFALERVSSVHEYLVIQ